MRLERVHLADVPSAGPNENYRAARGHCGEYTRVLTATLCTVADGFDRLVPIVASATVSPRLAESNRSDDDDVARLEEYHDDEFVDELGTTFGAGDSDANAREPLHAAYRYLRNCLHPARHPDVVRARRIRSKRPRDFEGSPSLDAFVEALGRAGLSPEMIRARFGSDHVGHRYVDDWGGGLYDPLELHDVLDGGRRQTYEDHSDGYWALWGSVETETLDAIEHFDRCFYGYDVSEVPAPTAPPPLSELRVAPRVVDDLVSSLADDANAFTRVGSTSASRRVRSAPGLRGEDVGLVAGRNWRRGRIRPDRDRADAAVVAFVAFVVVVVVVAFVVHRRLARARTARRRGDPESLRGGEARFAGVRIRRGDRYAQRPPAGLETLVRDELRGVRRRVWRELRRGQEVPRVLLHAGER